MHVLDPTGRTCHPDWDKAANSCVAELRAAYGHDPDFPRITEVVATLCAKGPEFAELWARHEVRGKTRRAKNLVHPEALWRSRWVTRVRNGPATTNGLADFQADV